MQLLNFSNLLTIAFGITSSITTIVGLVTIFISINRQHNIQKLRETLWEMERFPRTLRRYDDIDKEAEFCSLFTMYKNLYNSTASANDSIIKLAIFSLFIVIMIWEGILFLSYPLTFSKYEYGFVAIFIILGVVLLIGFIMFLDKLNNIKKSSNLPSEFEILNANNINEINTLLIAGQLLKLKIIKWKHRDTYQILLGLPLPFENIVISHEIYLGANNDLNEEADRYFDYIINAPNLLVKGRENISSFHSPYINFDDYYWYSLQTGVEIPVDREYIRVELTLWSDKTEEVNVYFGEVDINDFINDENDSVPSMIAYPKKVEVTDENTRLRGNITKELLLDLC